jgi:hypothetical protein
MLAGMLTPMAKSLWPERNLATMLLVRSVEEHDPAFFTPEALSAAALAAANARDDRELIEKRSAYLFLRLPASLRAWAHIGLLPESSLSAVVAAAFLAGGLSNFLGPSGLVHVVYNPLVFLVAWNVAAYALLAWRALHAPRAGLAGLLVRDLWSLWNRWAHRLPSERLQHAERIAATFRERYWAAAGPVVLARIEALLHAAAISLLLGAIGGTYVRGLFLEYNAIWRSTFLTDAETVTGLLNVLFAPGLWLLDQAPLATAQVQPLLSPQGTPAAPWIHRIALSAALVVLLPRAALALAAVRRALRRARQLEVDLQGDEYYLAQLRAARDSRIHRLREEIATIVRSGAAKLAESIALLVRERFFDMHVAPALLRFRNRGGRIRDLEAEIAAAREAFQPQLLAHLQDAQQDLETSVRASLERLVGRELALASAVAPGLAHRPLPLGQSLSGSMAESVGDGIGATVVMGITAVVASLSGGIGKSLGIAVVSSLLGTTGPIGLLIGGIAGLALAGTGYLVGRDRVTEAVKSRALPAALVAFALTDAKLDLAREATYATVKDQLAADLEPQVTAATEAILQRLAAAADAGGPPP